MKDVRWTVTPLEGLGKALRERERLQPSRPGRNALKCRRADKHSGSHEDPELLFRKAMADVREIAEFRSLPADPPPACGPARPRAEADRTMQELERIVKGRCGITLSDTDEYMEWTRKGVPPEVAARLHSGEVSVQETLDLHGCTVAEAMEELDDFFQEARHKRLSCVKVIHGRGLRSPKGPVLKEAVRKWLKRYSLAYATARSMDGGLGATYVLLRY